VHICDACVDICVDILTEERQLAAFSSSTATTDPRSAAALSRDVVICSLCQLPTPAEHGAPIPDRGFLCRPCLEAAALVYGEHPSSS
jgi:hypothetical protein